MTLPSPSPPAPTPTSTPPCPKFSSQMNSTKLKTRKKQQKIWEKRPSCVQSHHSKACFAQLKTPCIPFEKKSKTNRQIKTKDKILASFFCVLQRKPNEINHVAYRQTNKSHHIPTYPFPPPIYVHLDRQPQPEPEPHFQGNPGPPLFSSWIVFDIRTQTLHHITSHHSTLALILLPDSRSRHPLSSFKLRFRAALF